VEKQGLGHTGLETSRLAYGCMRIAGDGISEARGMRAVHAAFNAGYTLFDLADIYAGGESERVFGKVLAETPALRDQVVIASKCGVRVAGDPLPESPKRYDFSRDHIIGSVEASLRRMGIDCLDLLLLHRPDYLMHTAEVAAAFDRLQASGKVSHFGVSNFSTSQVDLLQSALRERLAVNQVEINIHNIAAFRDGVLDQCQRLGMTPQAWCPLGGVVYPAWGNTLGSEDDSRIADELARQSAIYGEEPWVVILAWLLAHPAGISPIVGSTTPARIETAMNALYLDYSREDWYRLLEARTGREVP